MSLTRLTVDPFTVDPRALATMPSWERPEDHLVPTDIVVSAEAAARIEALPADARTLVAFEPDGVAYVYDLLGERDLVVCRERGDLLTAAVVPPRVLGGDRPWA